MYTYTPPITHAHTPQNKETHRNDERERNKHIPALLQNDKYLYSHTIPTIITTLDDKQYTHTHTHILHSFKTTIEIQKSCLGRVSVAHAPKSSTRGPHTIQAVVQTCAVWRMVGSKLCNTRIHILLHDALGHDKKCFNSGWTSLMIKCNHASMSSGFGAFCVDTSYALAVTMTFKSMWVGKLDHATLQVAAKEYMRQDDEKHQHRLGSRWADASTSTPLVWPCRCPLDRSHSLQSCSPYPYEYMRQILNHWGCACDTDIAVIRPLFPHAEKT
jgi:hypothetical protein